MKKSCDCPYKKSCYLIRQELQAGLREKNKRTIEECDFYKELKKIYEDLKIDINKEIDTIIEKKGDKHN